MQDNPANSAEFTGRGGTRDPCTTAPNIRTADGAGRIELFTDGSSDIVQGDPMITRGRSTGL